MGRRPDQGVRHNRLSVRYCYYYYYYYYYYYILGTYAMHSPVVLHEV